MSISVKEYTLAAAKLRQQKQKEKEVKETRAFVERIVDLPVTSRSAAAANSGAQLLPLNAKKMPAPSPPDFAAQVGNKTAKSTSTFTKQLQNEKAAIHTVIPTELHIHKSAFVPSNAVDAMTADPDFVLSSKQKPEEAGNLTLKMPLFPSPASARTSASDTRSLDTALFRREVHYLAQVLDIFHTADHASQVKYFGDWFDGVASVKPVAADTDDFKQRSPRCSPSVVGEHLEKDEKSLGWIRPVTTELATLSCMLHESSRMVGPWCNDFGALLNLSSKRLMAAAKATVVGMKNLYQEVRDSRKEIQLLEEKIDACSKAARQLREGMESLRIDHRVSEANGFVEECERKVATLASGAPIKPIQREDIHITSEQWGAAEGLYQLYEFSSERVVPGRRYFKHPVETKHVAVDCTDLFFEYNATQARTKAASFEEDQQQDLMDAVAKRCSTLSYKFKGSMYIQPVGRVVEEREMKKTASVEFDGVQHVIEVDTEAPHHSDDAGKSSEQLPERDQRLLSVGSVHSENSDGPFNFGTFGEDVVAASAAAPKAKHKRRKSVAAKQNNRRPSISPPQNVRRPSLSPGLGGRKKQDAEVQCDPPPEKQDAQIQVIELDIDRSQKRGAKTKKPQQATPAELPAEGETKKISFTQSKPMTPRAPSHTGTPSSRSLPKPNTAVLNIQHASSTENSPSEVALLKRAPTGKPSTADVPSSLTPLEIGLYTAEGTPLCLSQLPDTEGENKFLHPSSGRQLPQAPPGQIAIADFQVAPALKIVQTESVGINTLLTLAARDIVHLPLEEAIQVRLAAYNEDELAMTLAENKSASFDPRIEGLYLKETVAVGDDIEDEFLLPPQESLKDLQGSLSLYAASRTIATKPPLHVPVELIQLLGGPNSLRNAKAHSLQWVNAAVLELFKHIEPQRVGTVANRTIPLSSVIYSHYKAKYGLEKMANSYTADFVGSCRLHHPNSIRCRMLLYWANLCQFGGLPEPSAASFNEASLKMFIYIIQALVRMGNHKLQKDLECGELVLSGARIEQLLELILRNIAESYDSAEDWLANRPVWYNTLLSTEGTSSEELSALKLIHTRLVPTNALADLKVRIGSNTIEPLLAGAADVILFLIVQNYPKLIQLMKQRSQLLCKMAVKERRIIPGLVCETEQGIQYVEEMPPLPLVMVQLAAWPTAVEIMEAACEMSTEKAQEP